MGIEIPKIEVRYENLSVEGDVYVGSRALPTLLNATFNTLEVLIFCLFNLLLSTKLPVEESNQSYAYFPDVNLKQDVSTLCIRLFHRIYE